MVVVESGDSTGFDNDLCCTGGLCAFRKVLRAVGDVVDKVSNRKLVEVFPKSDGTLLVSNESFGRLAGDGRVVENVGASGSLYAIG